MSNESYYGVKPSRPTGGLDLSSVVVADNGYKPMEQVEQDSATFPTPVKDPLYSMMSDQPPVKKKAGDNSYYGTGEDAIDGSGMVSESDCKYPVEAEALEMKGKGFSPEDDKAEIIQDKEISSSSKPQRMEMDENGFPVGIDKMKFGDVIIPKEDYPVWYKEGQYDGLLVYHEKDKVNALKLREKMQSKYQADGKRIRICYLQQNTAEDAGKNENEKLEYYCKKSTYLMMFLTKDFCEDETWMYFYQNRIIIHSVTDPTKKWCAIPIHSEYWRTPKTYKTPFALQGIRGICLEDSHWEDGAERMFRERDKLLKERLFADGLEFKRWHMKEQGMRLIQWKKDKKKYLEKVKRDEEEMQRQIEAAENEPMEQDSQPPYPPVPKVAVQRNVGATREHVPPSVPLQAWGSSPQPQVPHPGQNPAAAMPGMTSPQGQMSPEMFQMFQMFMATQQKQQMNPNMSNVQLQNIDAAAMKNLVAGIPVGRGPAPVININADVVNFGDHATIASGAPHQESDDDDLDGD